MSRVVTLSVTDSILSATVVRPVVTERELLAACGAAYTELRGVLRQLAREGRLVEVSPGRWAALPSRPTTRADCREGPRPCPWYGCRYHLGCDVTATGQVRLRDLGDGDTCVLDVAERGGLPEGAIGELMGLGPDRIHQVELEARRKVRRIGDGIL